MKLDRLILDLAARQHSAVARRQLNEAGVDYQAVSRRIASGMLESVTDRVLKVAASPATPAQRLMISVLHVGSDAFVSHTTAAAWWGIAGFRIDQIHVAIERFRRVDRCDLHKVHHSTVIPPWSRKLHLGVPVVSPALAIYQMAGTISEHRVARAMDNAWSLRLIDGPVIDRLLKRLGRSGRDGTVLMRKLRKERPDDWTPPASNLESRFGEIMEPQGFRFRRQVDVGDEEWSGRVDFLAEDLPLIVEILSERYHTSLTDRAVDDARRARHTSMGFLVVEVWDFEIFHTPWLVVERITKARSVLLARSTR
jgi:very-short-patch-repair endonuclease